MKRRRRLIVVFNEMGYSTMLRRAGLGIGLLTVSFAALAEGPRVALIPVVNLAGENWEQLKTRQVNECNTYLHDQFKQRDFTIVGEDKVLSEMKREGVDFKDEENQRRAVMFQLGQALHADFLVFAVITDTSSSTNSHVVYSDEVGHATAKMWILDVVHQKVILGGRKIDSESGGSRLALNNKGSDRQVQAAVNAVRDGLKDFLSGWPVVKPQKS